MFPQTEADKHYATIQAELMQLVPPAQSADHQGSSNDKADSSLLTVGVPVFGVHSISLDTPALTFSRRPGPSSVLAQEDFDDADESDYSDDSDDMPPTPWVPQAPLHSDQEFSLSFQPLAPIFIPRPVSWTSDFPSLNNQTFESNFLGLQLDLSHSASTRIHHSGSHSRSSRRARQSSVSAEHSPLPDGAPSHAYRPWPTLETTFQPDLKDEDSYPTTRPVRLS